MVDGVSDGDPEWDGALESVGTKLGWEEGSKLGKADWLGWWEGLVDGICDGASD